MSYLKIPRPMSYGACTCLLSSSGLTFVDVNEVDIASKFLLAIQKEKWNLRTEYVKVECATCVHIIADDVTSMFTKPW
jgi:hypothetical protein